ncbi:hypothetical protein D3C80_1512130 [compost metagenome]
MGGLVAWQHFGVHVIDAQSLGDDHGAAAVVTGQQVAADALPGQLLHGLSGTGLETVAKSEQAQHTRLRAAFDQPRQGPAFGFPVFGTGLQVARLQAALVEHTTVAQGQFATVQAAGDPASGQ